MYCLHSTFAVYLNVAFCDIVNVHVCLGAHNTQYCQGLQVHLEQRYSATADGRLSLFTCGMPVTAFELRRGQTCDSHQLTFAAQHTQQTDVRKGA